MYFLCFWSLEDYWFDEDWDVRRGIASLEDPRVGQQYPTQGPAEFVRRLKIVFTASPDAIDVASPDEIDVDRPRKVLCLCPLDFINEFQTLDSDKMTPKQRKKRSRREVLEEQEMVKRFRPNAATFRDQLPGSTRTEYNPSLESQYHDCLERDDRWLLYPPTRLVHSFVSRAASLIPSEERAARK